MRIGVLGGTFDPPHMGHLVIAEETREYLGLAKVYFVPAREPPHKLGQAITPLPDRIEMLRLALGDNPLFAISLIEADRPGPSYTVDTVRELLLAFPPATEVFFIMGMDSLVNLPTWHEPCELIQLCQLAVLRRPGYAADLDELERVIPGIKSRVVFIPAPEMELSSSDLQRRAQERMSVHYMVPEAVARYIEERRLYRQDHEI